MTTRVLRETEQENNDRSQLLKEAYNAMMRLSEDELSDVMKSLEVEN